MDLSKLTLAEIAGLLDENGHIKDQNGHVPNGAAVVDPPRKRGRPRKNPKFGATPVAPAKSKAAVIPKATQERFAVLRNNPKRIDVSQYDEYVFPDQSLFSDGEVLTRTELMSPARAASDLEFAEGHNYRPIDDKWADEITKDFLEGRFEFNHKPIEYDEEGILHDGQHRLRAIVKSGMTLPFVCVYGSRPTLSEGAVKSRTMRDHFRNKGCENVTAVTAAVKNVCNYMNGNLDKSGHKPVSRSEQDAMFDLCPDIQEFANVAVGLNRLISAGIVASVMYISCRIVSKRDISVAKEFVEKLHSGANLQHDDPIRMLRERMLYAKSRTAKMLFHATATMVIKAWNAYIKGEKLTRLRYDPADKFPEIQ